MAEKKKARPRKSKKASLKSVAAKLLRFIVSLAVPFHLAMPFLVYPSGIDFLLTHLTYLVGPLVVLIAVSSYSFANYSRTHPPKDKRGKPRRPPKSPYSPLSRVLSDANDIIANLDNIVWRILYLLGFAASILVPIYLPVTFQDFQNLDTTLRPIMTSAGVPALLAIFLVVRISSVMRKRRDWIEEVYAIARDCFDYKPLPERGTPTKRQRITATPHMAVEVRKWKTLTEGDTFFVWVPEKLSASDVETWDEFSLNLEEKLPREEEWRVRTKGYRGKGALVGPANYPRSVLWDGEYDPDPLTFRLGANLEITDTYRVTFNDASPHMCASGGTSSGKTSAAEVIAAQILVTPMPWDKNLYGQVHILDPKGPFAQRWTGRPNVIVSNGQKDSEIEPYIYDDEGNIVCEKTGVMVMAEHMQHIEDEHKRRAETLSRYPDAATWTSLPDEVKREEKFFPMGIILDEFLDHTSPQKGKGTRTELENEAREFIVSMTDWQLRKARNVGIHFLMISQRANMKLIGDTMMTNMPIRLVTGQIDNSQLQSMFALPATDVPRLPSTYHDPESGRTKTIPGRARILNALGQSISKIQVMWFGGGTNSATLDKWLPRGEKPLNGSFELPKGTRPRRKSDFDSDGNFIGEPDAAATSPDGESSEEATPAESEDVETVKPGKPDADEPDAGEGETEDTVEEPQESPDEDTEVEQPSIFPAATEENGCQECKAPSSWACPECERDYCTEHGERTRNPDPDAEARFVCGECAAQNPLKVVGLSAVLPEVSTKVRRYRLHYEHSIQEDEAGQYGQLRVRAEEGGKKIVEVISRPQEGAADNGFTYTARSSSGTVEGLAAVEDRIEVAISTFVRKRKDQTAGAQTA